jgi:N-acetylmuramoyl-L-alanine amidase
LTPAGRNRAIAILLTAVIVCICPWCLINIAVASGGHDSMGANSLNTDWYFSEGTTRNGFTTYIAVMNPDTTPARVTFTYMMGSGPPVVRDHTVDPESRFTLDISKDVGPDKDVSTFLKCDRPVVAERPMYFNYDGTWDGGHDSLGANALNTDWYFAEGTTRENFATYITVMNPAATDTDVTFTYMTDTGGPLRAAHTVPSESRFTLDISKDVGPDKDVSTFLKSEVPVVAERPMYFSLPQSEKHLVCIDPGHSGRDGSEIDPATGLNVGDNTGAAGELEANWDLALRTRARLEGAGYRVKLTKTTVDAYASLRQRADTGNTCEVMVRLHYDDTGFTGVMRPPLNAARCPVSDPGRITVVSSSVAAESDVLARTLAPFLDLAVRDDTGGTSQGNTTPAGHPTCLIGSVLSTVPIVCIENKVELARDPGGREQITGEILQGLNAYFRMGSGL